MALAGLGADEPPLPGAGRQIDVAPLVRGLYAGNFKFMRQSVETFISRPKPGAFSQGGRSQQMRIDVTDAASHQAMVFDKEQHLVLLRQQGLRQGGQQRQNFGTRFQLPASQFANHEGVAERQTGFKNRSDLSIALPQVIDPDRCIKQDHDAPSLRRRGTGFNSGSLPPSRASRRALSR